MDTAATPPAKNRRLPGKKLALAILILLLAAGAAAGYWYRQRPESAGSDDSSQQGGEAGTFEAISAEDLDDRYAAAQEELETVDELSDSEKINLYIRLAYDAAALNKDEARGYAQEALKLAPPPSQDNEATKSIRATLTEIAAGDYATAKATILGPTEE